MPEIDWLGSIVVIVLVLAAVCETISGHIRWSTIGPLFNYLTQWAEFG